MATAPSIDTNSLNHIIVDFDIIIDVDLCILKTIQTSYNNPNIIDQDVMHLDLHDIKEALINRKNENPVTICIHDKDTADKIYKELIETKYEEVLSRANTTFTGISKMIGLFYNKGFDVTILCQNELESKIIHEFNPKFKTLVDTRDKIPASNYNCFFTKSLLRVFDFDGQLKQSHIYIAAYRYNIFNPPDGSPSMFPDPNLSMYLIPANRIGFVDVYCKDDNIHLRR